MIQQRMKVVFLCTIFVIALMYRVPNLQTPFWVDEFSTARNALLLAREGFEVFTQRNEFFEHHNITEHLLVAVFFRLFGISEQSARLPSVLIGSLVPVAVYLVARKLFDRNTALAATAFSLFSYFEITWARQARSYMLLQFLILMTLWSYIDLVKKFSAKRVIPFAICLVLGMLTHTTFLLFIFALLLHFVYLCFHWNFFNLAAFKRFLPYILIACGVGLILLFNNNLQAIIGGLSLAFSAKPNNLWYYHSFLWREQTLLAFLAMFGVLLNFLKYHKGTFLILVPILCYLFFVSFLFPPYVSRYLLPIFPLLCILAGFAISGIGTALHPKFAMIIVLVVTGMIIGNGDKFVLKPKQYYSVNRDMREIALIDYNQVYNLIKEKSDDENNVAIIDTWPDRARWYVGYDNPNVYYFHWENEEGVVNGLAKKTSVIHKGQEKLLPGFNNPPIRFVGSIEDLSQVMKSHQKGFIWIDDASLPSDVLEFAKKNFRQELFLDHYTLDDNPYSIWPGTLYSWGY